MLILYTVVAAALGVVAVALVGPGLPRRHPKGARLCPGCGADVSTATHLRCSACDHTWTSAREIETRRLRLGRVTLGLFAGVLAAVSAWAAYVIPSHWTDMVPRPVMRELLSLAVEAPRRARDSQFPAPDPALMASARRWDQLVAQQQAVIAIEMFVAMVEGSDGSPPSLEALGLAARDLHRSSLAHLAHDPDDAWVVHAAVERARAIRDEIDARCDSNRMPRLGAYLASELQHFDDDVFLAEDWIEPPWDVHEILRQSSWPSLRIHVAERMKYMTLHWGDGPLAALCVDEDDAVRTAARAAALWRAEVYTPAMIEHRGR